MENTIVRRKPSEEAIKEAKKSIDRAKSERLETMGRKKIEKDQQVIAEIGKVLQEQGKDEKKTVAKEEKGESR